MTAGRPRAVLLDALGTLLELEDPGPPLAEALGALGEPVSVEEARAAVLAEMVFYREHHDEARDHARLVDLRRRCAEVLRDALPPQARALSVSQLTEALLGALRFRPYPEVPAALAELRDRGHALVVLSNWDVSLHEQLAATGLAALVDGAVSSAEAGCAKPRPGCYAQALELASAQPSDAVMVGDSLGTDIAGAMALDIAAVLVDRAGTTTVPPNVPVVRSLAEVGALIESLV